MFKRDFPDFSKGVISDDSDRRKSNTKVVLPSLNFFVKVGFDQHFHYQSTYGGTYMQSVKEILHLRMKHCSHLFAVLLMKLYNENSMYDGGLKFVPLGFKRLVIIQSLLKVKNKFVVMFY